MAKADKTDKVAGETVKARRRQEIPENETSADRFRRVAAGRVNNALAAIRVIGNLASKTYEYTPEQTAKILTALRAEVDAVERAFRNPSNGKRDPGFML